jgi:hypothetical protein
MSKKKYPFLDGDNALIEYLHATLFRFTQNKKYEDWFIELENADVVEYLNSKRKFLLSVNEMKSLFL